MADRNGYIGRAPGDSAVTVARQTFSPTGVTTDFTFASGYTVGYLDLFLNGTKLIEGVDYNATDTSTISLVSAAISGDVLEGVAYKAFNLGDASRIGIQSAGTLVGNVNTLNFVGVGNSILLNGGTIDIQIEGGGGGGSTGAGGTWSNYDGVTGVTTTKKVKIQNDLEVTGVTTSTGGFVGNITGTTGSFSGNVSIGGTLTYEDVINVDSVGLVTARTGVRVVGGGLTVTGVSTFFGGIDLPDSNASPNGRISIGDGAGVQAEDAQIYHNSTYGTVFQDTTNTGIQIWTGGTGGIKGQNGTDFIVKTNGGTRNVELYSGGSLRLATTGAGVTVTGIASATAFTGYDYLQAPFNTGVGATVTYSVTVATKDSTHRYQSQANGGPSGSSANGYKINGVFAPFLTLTPGRTYRFNQLDSSNNSHPIVFYKEADKTTEYSTGVVYNADGSRADAAAYNTNFNSASSTRYVEITVSDSTPVILHYQCYNHGYMGNAVNTNSNVAAEQSSGGITTEAATPSNAVVSLNLSNAVDHKVTATGICTITTTADGTEGESHTVRIINSGIATVGFSTYFLFPSGSAPSMPTADGAISLISFTVNRVGAGGTQLLAGASVNYS